MSDFKKMQKIYIVPKSKAGYLSYFLIFIFCITLVYSCSTKGEVKKAGIDKGQVLVADAVILKGRGLENNVYTTGSLISNESIELKAPVAGMIMELNVREGEKVKTGQKLVQLDDREWQSQLHKFQAQLVVAEKNLERSASLLEINGISQEIVDQGEGNVAALKASIEEVKVKIDQSVVKAPFEGYIGLRSVSMGEFVTAGTAMASLVQSNPIKLDFSLPGKYASQLKAGQEVFFNVDGVVDTLKGVIYALEPKLDETSRTIRVRAKADNAKGLLFPGAFANVRVTLDLIKGAVVVPTEAVIPELNAQKVFIIKEGKAIGQQVNLGIRSGNFVQVTEGLVEGDTVMVTGLLQVHENMPVKVGEIVNNQNSN